MESETKAQIEAKEYIKAHNISMLLNSALHSLATAKPPNPSLYLFKHFASMLSKSDLESHGIVIDKHRKLTNGHIRHSLTSDALHSASKSVDQTNISDSPTCTSRELAISKEKMVILSPNPRISRHLLIKKTTSLDGSSNSSTPHLAEPSNINSNIKVLNNIII